VLIAGRADKVVYELRHALSDCIAHDVDGSLANLVEQRGRGDGRGEQAWERKRQVLRVDEPVLYGGPKTRDYELLEFRHV
jgi:hypothetical protein